jgi:hypothetical protein
MGLKAGLLVCAAMFSSVALAVNVRTSVSVPDKKDCDLRANGVENYRDLVQKVSIRGKDTRKLSTDNDGVLPFGCEEPDGRKTIFATATLSSKDQIITVLHNVVDTDTCKAYSDLKKCFVQDGDKQIAIESWSGDLEKECKKGKDSIIVGNLKTNVTSRDAIDVVCTDAIDLREIKTVETRAAISDNFKQPDLRKEIIVGSGKYYGVDRESKSLKFEADSGPGASGGPLVTQYSGRDVAIGIIRGNAYRGEAKKAFDRQGHADGAKADSDDNFGEAFPIFSGTGIPCKESI